MPACALALVLLLDASSSVRPEGWRTQVEGHAQAFEHEAVLSVIDAKTSTVGPIAISAFSFSDNLATILPWHLLHNRQDALAFAAALRQRGPSAFTNLTTMTSAALTSAFSAFDHAPCDTTERQIVDLTTDGRADDYYSLPAIREQYILNGVTLNGIYIETEGGLYNRERFREPSGLEWLRNEVITPDGFALPAFGWQDFIRSIRIKIHTELS